MTLVFIFSFHAESPVVLTLQSGRQADRGGGTDTAKCREDIRGAHNHFTKIARVLIWRGGYQLSAVNIDTGSLSPHWKHDTSQPTGDSAHGWLNFYFARSKCTEDDVKLFNIQWWNHVDYCQNGGHKLIDKSIGRVASATLRTTDKMFNSIKSFNSINLISQLHDVMWRGLTWSVGRQSSQ